MLWIHTYFYNNYLSLWYVIRFPKNETRNFPQLSYILITSCIQEFRVYVQSTLLYGLRDDGTSGLLSPFGRARHYLRRSFTCFINNMSLQQYATNYFDLNASFNMSSDFTTIPTFKLQILRDFSKLEKQIIFSLKEPSEEGDVSIVKSAFLNDFI